VRLFVIAVLVLGAPSPALAQSSGTLSYRQDARTEASDEDVRVARRAYRAECQRHHSADYCECMTGGMAQALAPNDLRTATALLANPTPPANLDRESVAAAEAASANFAPYCAAAE